MLQRDILFNQVANDVHRTDWKTIYGRYSEYLPIRLAYKDAKEYFEAQAQGQTTSAYEEIRGYAEKVAKQKEQMRRPAPVAAPIKTKKKK